MYFKDFPTFFYEFDINGEKSLTAIKDITRNIRFRRDILANVTVYDEYDIQEGDTPEIISEKVYGSPQYHWVVMLMNENYDYINDFPLSELELEQYVHQKYGNYTEDMSDDLREAENILAKFTIHHYERSDGLVLFDPSQYPQISYEVKFKKEDNSGILLDEFGRELVAENSVEDIVDPPQVTDNDLRYPVTNWDYERRINESKRRIKLLPPELLNKVLQEFEELL